MSLTAICGSGSSFLLAFV